MGEAGAGHFVKAVHNGIEYADMQMIAEVYGVMRDGLGMTAPQIGAIFAALERRRRCGPTSSRSRRRSSPAADPLTGAPMLDVILDSAGQKGTGRWTAIEAQHLAAPIPVIEAAIDGAQRLVPAGRARGGRGALRPAPRSRSSETLEALEQALIAGKILCYAQGFAMISAASASFGWSLPLPEIARVWRAGCIIRSAMLNDMATALTEDPGRNLILAPFFAERIEAGAARAAPGRGRRARCTATPCRRSRPASPGST